MHSQHKEERAQGLFIQQGYISTNALMLCWATMFCKQCKNQPPVMDCQWALLVRLPAKKNPVYSQLWALGFGVIGPPVSIFLGHINSQHNSGMEDVRQTQSTKLDAVWQLLWQHPLWAYRGEVATFTNTHLSFSDIYLPTAWHVLGPSDVYPPAPFFLLWNQMGFEFHLATDFLPDLGWIVISYLQFPTLWVRAKHYLKKMLF